MFLLANICIKQIFKFLNRKSPFSQNAGDTAHDARRKLVGQGHGATDRHGSWRLQKVRTRRSPDVPVSKFHSGLIFHAVFFCFVRI
jgi:hypothetical protein